MADSTEEATKKANEELGRLTALTLMEEMRFLGKLTDRSDNNDLIDFSEKRPDFQNISGESAAKSNKAGNFVANLAGLRYCVADGEVGKTGLFDIDHTHAFSDILKKQKALLAYLNNPANADFAAGFLSATGIKQYFGIHSDKSIKGTKRFYKLCYNDIDNLLLLCHSCNMHKSSKESLEWFGKQEPFLGEKFVKAVIEAGGFHDGIIIKKVMQKGAATPLVKIGDVECILHARDKKVFGMGEFIQKWFEEKNPGYRDDIIKAYGSIWLSLKGIFETRLSQEEKLARQTKKESDKLTLVLRQTIQTIDTHYGMSERMTSSTLNSLDDSSQSSSDDEHERAVRLQGIDRQVKTVFTHMHEIKKFYKAMSQGRRVEVPKEAVFNLLLDDQEGLYSLESARQKNALLEMKKQILALDPNKPITQEIAQEIIKKVIDKNSVKGVEREKEVERQKKEEAEERAETERKEKEEAEKRAETERKEKEEAQQKIAEQNELIAKLMAAQRHYPDNDKQTSGSDTPSPSENTTTPQFHALTRTSAQLDAEHSPAKKLKTDKRNVSPTRSRSASPTRKDTN